MHQARTTGSDSAWSNGPLLFGHRGAAMYAPENTIVSFALALEQGADALELDVHASLDGEVVVAHDDTGARMCGVDRAIAQTAWRELRDWDAGHGFVDASGDRPFRNRDLRMPKLDDVLDAFPGVPINIDVKPDDPAFAMQVARHLMRRSDAQRVLLTSFHVDVVTAIRCLSYQGPTGTNRDEIRRLVLVPRALRALVRIGGDRVQVPTHTRRLRLDTPRFVRMCHAAGLAVDYWVINEPDEAARLIALGADGIMSDAPAKVRAAVAKKAPR